MALATVSLLAFTACGSDDDANKTPAAGTTPTASKAAGTDYSGLSGNIVVDGSSTVGPITEAMAEEFGKVSDVRVAVGISGTGGGFEKFCKGETDINDASRPIKKDDAKEGAGCAVEGIEYVEFKVAIDGLTVVVNPDNGFIECMTFAQLKQIWDTGSTVTKWSDVDPAFPGDDIKLFSPGADSGTFDYFTEAVNGKTDQARNDSVVSFSEDDNVLVQGVENNESALGYFGYAYYQGEKDNLKAVLIDKAGDGTCVAPTDDTVIDNSYPLSRPLFLYVSKAALARPEVQGFVEFYLTNPELVGDVGYVRLPQADYDKGLADLAAN